MIETEPVDWPGDPLHVALLHMGSRTRESGWVATEELRLGKGQVPVFVEQGGRCLIALTEGASRLHVNGAERRRGRLGAQGIDGRAMRQINVMNGPVQGGRIGEARRMPAKP